jgi:transposase
MAEATAPATFSDWLDSAGLCEERLSGEQLGILQAAHHFRQAQGSDYYSTRLLSHFLLHAATGLKVAHIARLLGISRPTASRQQGLTSRQAIQQAHHRLDGRPYGKLLPRYAGAIATFLVNSPDASRADLIDFVQATFGVRASRTALYKFLKKYGLDQIGAVAAVDGPAAASLPKPREQPVGATTASAVVPLAPSAPPFSWHARSTPAPSC